MQTSQTLQQMNCHIFTIISTPRISAGSFSARWSSRWTRVHKPHLSHVLYVHRSPETTTNSNNLHLYRYRHGDSSFMYSQRRSLLRVSCRGSRMYLPIYGLRCPEIFDEASSSVMSAMPIIERKTIHFTGWVYQQWLRHFSISHYVLLNTHDINHFS
jgi:hypothetical protein